MFFAKKSNSLASITVPIVSGCLALLIPAADAAVPLELSYQGVLRTSAGAIVPDSSYALKFELYDDSLLTTLLWSEDDTVTTEGGVFSTFFGDDTPLNHTMFEDYIYLRVFESNSVEEFLPATRFTSSPYAIVSGRVEGDFKSRNGHIIILDDLGLSQRITLHSDSGLLIPSSDALPRVQVDDEFIELVNTGPRSLELRAAELDLVDTDSTLSLRSGAVTITRSGVWSATVTPRTFTLYDGSTDLLELDASGTSGSLFIRGATPTTLTLSDNSVTASDGGDNECVIDPDDVTITDFLGGGTINVRADGVQLSGSANTHCTLTDEDLALIDTAGASQCVLSADELGISGLFGGGTINVRADGVQLSGSANTHCTLTDEDLALIDTAGSTEFRLDATDLTFTDLGGGPDSVIFSRAGGLVLVAGSSGTNAVYTYGGIHLTGPTARQFAANPTAISLTRPSTNAAMICDLGATDLCVYDLDDDGAPDIVLTDTPTPRLRLAVGTSLRCDGPAELTTCDVSGAATYGSTVDVSGGMMCGGTLDVTGATSCSSSLSVSGGTTCSGTFTCKSSSTHDMNNDATDDVTLSAAPTPTLSLASGTTLDCLGPANFSSPVFINSDLMVTGAKAFAQEHPDDPEKEIIYVALEGNEAGTYCRGTAQLSDGKAIISLPEDFSMVTFTEGLTAQLTPRGPVKSMLWIERVSKTELVVRSSHPDDSNTRFDYFVNGVRDGFQDHKVIRKKNTLAVN